MRFHTAIAIGCCSLLTATGLSLAQPKIPDKEKSQPESQPQIITSVTVEQIATVLQGAGYRAEVATGSNGKKFIKTAMNGAGVAVYFYGCTNENCNSLSFSTYLKKDPNRSVAYANAWNIRYRFAKAYIDGDGDLVFDLDIDLLGGS